MSSPVATPPADPTLGAADRTRVNQRRVRADSLAGLVVRIGGIGVIGSILAILLFIGTEVVPLAREAAVEPRAPIDVGMTPVAMVLDPYLTHAVLVSADGRLETTRLSDLSPVQESSLGELVGPPTVTPGSDLVVAPGPGGSVILAPLEWKLDFVGGARQVSPVVPEITRVPLAPAGTELRLAAARTTDGGTQVIVGQTTDGRLVGIRRVLEENMFTGEVTAADEPLRSADAPPLQMLLVDDRGNNIYATDGAELLWWTIEEDELVPGEVAAKPGSPITTLTLLLGGRSVVAGHQDGHSSVWFTAEKDGHSERLHQVRVFPTLGGPVRHLAPSRRDKGFVAVTANGRAGLYYSTSSRVMWTGDTAVDTPTALAFSPKADAAFLGAPGSIRVFDVSNPHPEISLQALFGKVWYESYPGPAHVWQSSSGTDDFEPKFSLTPLLVGTLKGTLYSLLIAIPLAVFGAMYLAHFMAPELRRVVKPTIEVMAALPSVVLGFLAGLWLAPRVEQIFPGLLLLLLSFPFVTVGAGLLWQRLPLRVRNRLPVGSEVACFVLALTLATWGTVGISGLLETTLFGGDFQAWLLGSTGLPYDQRNAIVVGIAMGFAVIPIIFAISEDAFANVPNSLVSGSLALGANRWQTVTRVVLPTASPGIFSAIMVGFGRAVGETMIVLMATGNTPIMDWNPFNGFRTLSANIAVEIPEAPQFGTLYRVLFLAALLLFFLTFFLNTAAEIVRHRLRKRYGEL